MGIIKMFLGIADEFAVGPRNVEFKYYTLY